DVSVGHPAHGVVGADDLRAGAPAVRQLLRRLAADVRAEEVVDALLAERAEDRELERLRDERQPEVEVKDVGAREQLRKRTPLLQLTCGEAAAELERPVRLRMEPVAVEDDELRVDAAAAEGLDVRPRDAGRVDRAVDDAEGHRRVRSSRGHAAATCGTGAAQASEDRRRRM